VSRCAAPLTLPRPPCLAAPSPRPAPRPAAPSSHSQSRGTYSQAQTPHQQAPPSPPPPMQHHGERGLVWPAETPGRRARGCTREAPRGCRQGRQLAAAASLRCLPVSARHALACQPLLAKLPTAGLVVASF